MENYQDMNPYASHLGNRSALEVIAETPASLRRLFETLDPEQTNRPPAPGKWSPREILCHLADCEVVFAFRLRQALAEDHHVIQPFDQDKWAAAYASYPASEALAVFSAVREWNRLFVNAVGAAALDRTLNHPERGDMTFQTVIETIAGHDLNHLRQLERIAAS